ncbi:MAG TPA: RNA polymerase subunit sigma-24, partial [Firmicutes bacterium]|nr:RNA polymerase subunit sigma-24 [Bacillota bacterium]
DVVFQSDEHAKAWFIRVTINSSKNLLTSAWFRKTIRLEDEYITTVEMESEVYHYVLALPTKFRTVIHLYYYEDYSTKEMAQLLKVKESTIRSWLHRARTQLKEMMKGDEGFEF